MNTTKSMSAYVAQREHEARNKKSDEPDLPNVALGKYAFASSEQRNDNKVCTHRPGLADTKPTWRTKSHSLLLLNQTKLNQTDGARQ